MYRIEYCLVPFPRMIKGASCSDNFYMGCSSFRMQLEINAFLVGIEKRKERMRWKAGKRESGKREGGWKEEGLSRSFRLEGKKPVAIEALIRRVIDGTSTVSSSPHSGFVVR